MVSRPIIQKITVAHSAQATGEKCPVTAIQPLAAAAPFHAGRDTGLASIRPKISEGLPRQDLPPVIPSWEDFARALAWGSAAGVLDPPAQWWWELRPHVRYGTLEIRVPDTQATVADAEAVAATLPGTGAPAAPVRGAVAEGGAITLGPAVFDDLGRLVELSGVRVHSAQADLWRAPVDNERATTADPRANSRIKSQAMIQAKISPMVA